MLISYEEMERRLKSDNNLANQLGVPSDAAVSTVVEKPKRVYTPQVKDEGMRVLAGTLAHLDKPSNVSRELGLTPQQVSSAAHSQKDSVRNAVDATRDRVSELALNQLLGVLGIMTPDTMIGEKPKDLAAIAANLSKVHQNMTPRDNKNSGIGAQVLIIHAPPQQDESRYKTVDV